MTSFGLAILGNILVAMCIAACAFCIGLRNRRRAAAHALWIAVFVKLITPPIYTIPLPMPAVWYDSIVAGSHVIPSNAKPNPHLGSNYHFGSLSRVDSSRFVREAGDLSYRLEWPTAVWWILCACWVTIAVLLLVRGAIRFVRLSRLLCEQGKDAEQASEFVQHLLLGEARIVDDAGQLGQKRLKCPSVRLVPIDMAPMLFGMGKSTSIVCPRRLWDALNVERRRAFLAHEVAHYLRRDHWVRWLEWIVSSVYWWLPLTHFARRQLERNEELACDQWVIHRLHIGRREYAETLFQVAEFLEDSHVASLRIASRMQPTDLLEERVESILRKPALASQVRPGSNFSIALVGLALLVHPYPNRLDRTHAAPGLSAELTNPAPGPRVSIQVPEQNRPVGPLGLPSAPVGWWNTVPSREWADLCFPESKVRLLATAGAGLRLQLSDGRNLAFPSEELSACVEIHGIHRLAVADTRGALRLWDLSDAAAVSLIGNHAAPITSLALHTTSGLVAADTQGSVIRWDYRSGTPLQTWTTQIGPVQSIRWSSTGEILGVLLGSWSEVASERQLVMLDAKQFEEQGRVYLPSEAAIAWHDETHGWLFADWRGHIHTLSGEPIYQVDKRNVSAFMLTQNAIIARDEQVNLSEESPK